MSKRDVIVIGASAGGLEVLRALIAELPAGFPASVFIVWHLSRDYPSQLAQVLSSSTSLPVTQAVDGEPIEPGHIYVACPNHHLVVDKEHVRVTRGPTENGLRPSIDVLFRSAALSQAGRVVSVVLSGALDDGVSGAFAVKERGGVTIIQDPTEALYPHMPLNVLQALKVDHLLGEVDYVLPVAEIGKMLARIADEPLEDEPAAEEEGSEMLSRMEIEVRIAREDNALENGVMELGTPSPFTCPECHGTLLQLKEGNRTRFRCHTGHAYSANILLAEVTKYVEDELWSAVRAIEESLMLLQHMGEHLQQAGEGEAARLFQQQTQRTQQQAAAVRRIAMSAEVLSEDKILRDELSPEERDQKMPPEPVD